MDPLIGVVVFALLALFLVSRRPRHKLPPGPTGIPLLGNVFGLPKRFEWLTYQRWGHEYGSDIIHFRILGTHVVVINSAKTANDIFEKRSGLCSDRPVTVMQQMTGCTRIWGLLSYGDYWRAHRKLSHRYFRAQEIPNYHQSMRKSVHQLLGLLRDSPENLIDQVRFVAGSNILNVMYAFDIESEDDPILVAVKEGMEVFSRIGNAGAFLVDSLPLLRYLPAWFPGAEFKRKAAQWKVIMDGMFVDALQAPKAALDRGEYKPCVATDMLYELGKEDGAMQQDVMTHVLGTAYGGAVDTTTSSLSSFILAMVLHPDIQRAAHEELSRVIGPNRLPEFEDKDSLPYITAIMQEILRWRPVLPLAVPHKSTVDFEYDGYYIPAGSLVVGNSWAILHDGDRYPNPEAFDPTRFLTSDGELNGDVPFPTETFGFSRRICPGRHFAMDVLWLAIANILATFEIEVFADEKGNVEEPSGRYTSGMFSFPENFKAKFKPRLPMSNHA